MTRRARLLNLWLRYTAKPIFARLQDPERARRLIERCARLASRPPAGLQFDTIGLERPGADALEALQITPEAAQGAGPILLYLHGGGYVFGSPRSYKGLVGHIARRTGLTAILPRYRLAPEHPFPAAPDDALTAYRAIMDHPGGIILGGDSAGGGLALGLLGQICALGLRQPVGTFCFSPFTDMTFSGESFAANNRADPILPARRAPDIAQMYMQGANPEDPRASPLFASFFGAGPVWITVGSTEILLDDARRMSEHLMQQGVDVTCVIAPDLPHVWPLFHGLIPEAEQSLAELSGWITSLSRL
ncbi:Acetyl esterase/lipase [Roseovarius nanhaiticus]|uniref:Acetyl esterase/lipase n=1 Tax=Roseovarius nanhaiticus TaxID=573024 RepID=A0A1N7EXS8_9RHOB|nr:alpha/beta hydrolase [Roseovarius nanhaiticus]SEK64764.1 Acetyl esterase/lipase [Roseovarius nanhaiticus]SIR92832.1 Acetyl esterase/lipase [Roseovarius nanhaiticus]